MQCNIYYSIEPTTKFWSAQCNRACAHGPAPEVGAGVGAGVGADVGAGVGAGTSTLACIEWAFLFLLLPAPRVCCTVFSTVRVVFNALLRCAANAGVGARLAQYPCCAPPHPVRLRTTSAPQSPQEVQGVYHSPTSLLYLPCGHKTHRPGRERPQCLRNVPLPHG